MSLITALKAECKDSDEFKAELIKSVIALGSMLADKEKANKITFSLEDDNGTTHTLEYTFRKK